MPHGTEVGRFVESGWRHRATLVGIRTRLRDSIRQIDFATAPHLFRGTVTVELVFQGGTLAFARFDGSEPEFSLAGQDRSRLELEAIRSWIDDALARATREEEEREKRGAE